MPAETVYLSWGGTGRAASFRAALAEASDADRSMIYLAVLDDAHFADVEADLLALAEEELRWLLDAQVDLTKRQAGRPGADVDVLIRVGAVADEVAGVLETLQATDGGGDVELVVGAPVPSSGDRSAAEVLASLEQQTGLPVRIVTA